MSKEEKLRMFVATLSEQEAREELVKAYLMMESCLAALDGKDEEPVEMRENGLDSDLELFYTCKKVKAERDMLDKDCKVKSLALESAIRRIDAAIADDNLNC